MKITILGCGNMGTAFARSLRKYGLVKEEDLLLIVRTISKRALLDGLGMTLTDIDERISDSDMVILAVKPQDLRAVAPALSKVLKTDQVVLSIMAGITLNKLADSLGHATVVRAMPNAPAQIGMGITAYATMTELNMMQTLRVEQVLNCTGRAIHLADENMLDPVTALSGTGPAYFFHIVATMIDTGVKLGLEAHVASALVKQTMLGSFHLMEHSDRTPEELIQTVKSKGGTTEAAFAILLKEDMAGILDRAIHAASERSKELASM